MEKNEKPELLPEHGYCFVCGSQNPKGIGLRWYGYKNGEIRSTFTLGKEQQGPPNFAHGGASAAILDEIMGMAAWYAGYKIVSVNLNINYLLPVPLGVELKARGYIFKKEGKKLFARGEIILPDGKIAVKGASVLVEPEGFFDGVSDEYKSLVEKVEARRKE